MCARKAPHVQKVVTHASNMKNFGLIPKARGKNVKMHVVRKYPIRFPRNVPDHA